MGRNGMSRTGTRWTLIASAALVAILAGTLSVSAHVGPAPEAEAALLDASGAEIGTVRFASGALGKVEVRVKVSGLPAGFHGFHVHTIGTCTAPDFTSAGGHFNPSSVSHPGHAADMPVVLVNADGNGWARFRTDRYAVADLFDADGSAVVVHANPDNYANIPTDRYDPDPDATTLATGDAGSRLACGVIEAH
jgi:Cu-Zn family superoxide dismutase